jgi:hypothetical protein
MIWKARIKTVGEWTESQIAAVSRGGEFTWMDQLMMRPDEWRFITERLGLSTVFHRTLTSP